MATQASYSPPFDPAIAVALQSQVLAALRIGIVACDADLVVLWWSAAAASLFRTVVREETLRVGCTLPAELAAAVRRSMRYGAPVRRDLAACAREVELTVLVVEGLPPVARLVFIRDEPDDHQVLERMRARYHLSVRGLQLVKELRAGKTNREIASALGLRENTIKVYLSHLFLALGVGSRGAAVALAERLRVEH